MVYETLEPKQLLTSFYVSNSGNDSSDGLTLGAPFQTIQQAASLAQPGDTVFVRGGTYRELVSLPRSGTQDNPITFQAYNNEDVVLSGGDLVTGWTQHSGNIWRATVNWNANNDRDANTLFVNGELKQFARQGAENDFFEISDWGQIPTGRITDGATSFRVDDLSGFGSDYWNGAKVRFHTHDYIVDTRTISDFSSNGTIFFDDALGNTSQKQTNGYYIYDTLNALDQAGEWYKDTGNTLYYQVEPGQNPNNLQIEFKRRAFAFDANGRDHIVLDGFEFRGASVQTSSNTDNNVYQGNHFYANDFDGYGALRVSGDNNTLRDNEFSHIWGAAVIVSGSRNGIVNNYIHHVGYQPTARVLSASNATELLVSHNTFRTFARSVMDGYPLRSEISYNVFEDGGKLTWDTGVFDSDGGNGNSSKSIFHHNIFRDNSSRGIFESFYGKNDNAVVHHNLIYDFNPNSSRTVFRANGISFRKSYHNTIISSLSSQPAGTLDAEEAVQTNYNNNIQISTDAMAAIGVDMRGNHNYTAGDFVSFGADFRLATGSAAIDAGIVLPGINDGFSGAAPDAGAFESGQAAWTAGHDFVNPPNPSYAWTALPGTNLYDNGQFLEGIGDWTVVSGTPNSLDRNSWNLQQSGATLTGEFRTQSVEFTPGEAIQRTFTGLTPNTTYTIGAAARVANQVTSGDQFNGSSGAIRTGFHRGEGYVTSLSAGNWIRFNDIDFEDAGQFQQIDLLQIRDPSNGFPGTLDGVRVQFRLDSANGPLLAEIDRLTEGNTGDRWLADRADFNFDASGLHDVYVSVTGGNSQNLALGSLRLLNDSTASSDLLTVQVQSAGSPAVNAQVGAEDWYRGYDEISFTTSAFATSATITFENQGRMNAYLDRFYLLGGDGTRGGAPRGVSDTAVAERSLTPTTSDSAGGVLDGSIFSSVETGDHAGSWIQVDLDEVTSVYSIKLSPNVSSVQQMTNFRVSVYNADPEQGGVEVWGQDYLTDGSSLSPGESLLLQADSYGSDGTTTLGETIGRFVRIQSLGPNNAGNQKLSLAELEIQLFDENNLAVTAGVPSQSSTESGQVATAAVDGDPTTRSATSPSTTNSWWQVQVVQPTSIGQIELRNHDGNNFDELGNFTVSVWDADPSEGGTKLWEKAYLPTGSVARGGSLIIDGSETSDSGFLRLASLHTATVVRVQLNGVNNAGNGRLSLAEVRVTPSSVAQPRDNAAQQGTASHTNEFYGSTSKFSNFGYAAAANDGVIKPRSSFTTTPSQFRPWWQVDLEDVTQIEQLVLYNRTDVANRLDDFSVSVWSGDPNSGGALLWLRNYGYSPGAATYSTSSIGPGGALIINGDATSGGQRLDEVDGARFVRVQLNDTNFLSLVEVQVWEANVGTSPTVVSEVRDGGSIARPDQLTTLSIGFDQDVDLEASDLFLVNDTAGLQLVDLSGVGFSYNSTTFVATWDFSSLTNSLDPAFYSYVLGTGVTSDVGGLPLDGNGAGGPLVSPLYLAIPGDANLDGEVTIFEDGFPLLGNLGLTSGVDWASGDFNADGKVDVFGDGFILLATIGQNVQPPVASPVAGTQQLNDESDLSTVASASTMAITAAENVDERPLALPARMTKRSDDRGGSGAPELTLAGNYDVRDDVFGADLW